MFAVLGNVYKDVVSTLYLQVIIGNYEAVWGILKIKAFWVTLYFYLIAAGAGVVLLVILILVVFCCIKCRRSSDENSMELDSK